MVAILLLLIMNDLYDDFKEFKKSGETFEYCVVEAVDILLEQVEQKGIKNRQYHWEQLFSNVTI